MPPLQGIRPYLGILSTIDKQYNIVSSSHYDLLAQNSSRPADKLPGAPLLVRRLPHLEDLLDRQDWHRHRTQGIQASAFRLEDLSPLVHPPAYPDPPPRYHPKTPAKGDYPHRF